MAWRRVLVVVLAAGLLGMGGCTRIARVFGARPPKVTVTPPRAHAPAARTPARAADATPVPPLKTIVREQLQRGHYATGRRQLHRYIQQHPDDRAARDMWKQLTGNPDTLLGSRSRTHVVQPGETYSSLAARFLGDADRFLILARYNDATNPSLLQVGQHVRVPLDARPHPVAKATSQAPAQPPVTATTNAAGDTADSLPEATVSKAERLQQQSLALLGQGHHQQALERMGQALALDPKLKSPGGKADDLRQQLLASYHQRAIVLYRDQKLSQAIGLWDRILAIDPDYEPAIIYRARARELQSRLKKL